MSGWRAMASAAWHRLPLLASRAPRWLLLCTAFACGSTLVHAAPAGEPQLMTLHRAQLIDALPGGAQARRTIELPLHWDVTYRRSGRAELVLPFRLPPDAAAPSGPYTLFITRLGNAYEIELNGVVLQTSGAIDTPRHRWSAKQPVTLNFPSDLLRAGDNELRVRLRADYGRRGGMSPVLLGPMRLVIPHAEAQERWRVVLPQAASVFSLMVAFFCAVLWWQQRDPLYAWAGLGETLWAVVVADSVVETAPLPWPAWGFTLVLLRALWVWTLYAIAEQVFGQRSRAERWTLLVVLAAIPLTIPAAIALQSALPLRLGHFALGAVWLVVIVRLARLATRQPSSDRVLLVIALAACLLAGVRDMIAARWDATLYDEPAWVKVMAPLIGMVVMWIVSVRFRRARAEVVELNATLAERVRQKECELRESFQRLSLAERSRAVAAERERILRDMHDGVGANLATAMRQLESGRAAPADLAAMLRESLDQLKLAIDAMNLPAGDVNALLASLRYRLQPRIEGAGLALHWDVAALPPWPAGDDTAMRHLQFLLLEAISNALQHAGARRLLLGAHVEDAQIEISLADDGCGIGERSAREPRTMRERAAAIGAELRIESLSPGTRVRLRLPVPAGATQASWPAAGLQA